MMKYLKVFIAAVILTVVLCGCSARSNTNSPSASGQSSDDSSPRQTGIKGTMTADEFIDMVNADNYIIGNIVESRESIDDSPYNGSYILITTGDQEYRVEGLCWHEDFTQTPLSLVTNRILYYDPPVGAQIVVFYDDENIDGNVIRPKDYDIVWDYPLTKRTVEDWINAREKKAERLIEIFNAIPRENVLSPEEAAPFLSGSQKTFFFRS